MIQFMRMSNVYFLATAILTTIPEFSPISPASTFAPLGFVIFMSIMREAYEDFVSLNAKSILKYNLIEKENK